MVLVPAQGSGSWQMVTKEQDQGVFVRPKKVSKNISLILFKAGIGGLTWILSAFPATNPHPPGQNRSNAHVPSRRGG